MLHVQLLGPVQVSSDNGHELTPPGARERNGLAALAIISPESLSTERLAAELYRERGTTDPRNAVQAMVSRLRRALGREAGSIETTANGYRLVDVTVDVDEAERLLREATASQELRQATDLLDQARALWRGPTLDGIDGELVDAERLRIDGLRHDVEDLVFERRVESGADNDPDLANDLEAAVRNQPLREQRWELLMLTLYRIGRQADALRAFQRARGLLAEHLGLEPGHKLVDLERRILEHDPMLDLQVTTKSEPGPIEPISAALPSGTLSLLLAEVEGSVRRWETDPIEAAAGVDIMHQVWTAAVERARGTIVNSAGDGMMAVFETAEDAVRAAAEAMSMKRGSNLDVKAALHTGTLEPTDGDYRGPVVNRCSRILDLAHGGQILVSGPTAELARGSMPGSSEDSPSSLHLRELGAHWLQDVPEPMVLWQLTGPGLQSVFPPLPSRDQTSLPRLRGRLLGRDKLVERVAGLVADETLVTLLGPGGIGKTSAALAVGWEVLGGRPVSFVDLARVDDPAVVAERLAEAVIQGADDDRRSPAERLTEWLSSSTELVIIDNAEHVLDAVTHLVDDVLTGQLKGSFLVTSRQPLGLPDEIIVGVPPLDVPDDRDDLGSTGRSPSVTLFIERAKALQPEFSVADGLLPVVAHICRRLDGIPLAIELAAGRATLLSVDDIAARLDDQLRLLRQVRSQRDRRHQSLDAVVRWSVDQLSAEAREVFDRMSVMAGSFGLDGLERLLVECGLQQIDALEAVDELHGASLIAVEFGGSRFRMLEPIRQFAAAELAERNLELDTRRAHVRWVTSMAAQAHNCRTSERAALRAKLDVEADQVLSALIWVADSAQSDLAADLAYPVGWWFLTHDSRAGERVLGRLLGLVDRDGDPLAWAKVVLGLSMTTAAHLSSKVPQHSVDAVAIFDEHDHPDRGMVRLAAVFAQNDLSGLELPQRLLDESDRLTSHDDRFGRALVDMSTMFLHGMELQIAPAVSEPRHGDQEDDVTTAAKGAAVVEAGRRAVVVFREFGESWALGTTLGKLGSLHHYLGDPEEAEACYLESLELHTASDYHGAHYVLTELARMATDRGQHERADRFNAEALHLAEIDAHDGCMAITFAGIAYAAEASGDIDTAISNYRRALDLTTGSIVELERVNWEQALDRLTA